MKIRCLLLALLCLLLTACSSTGHNNTVSQVHKDVVVRNYTSDLKEHDYIYKQPPKRIVAHWQNSIETLLALGAGDRIIAVAGLGNEKHLRPEHLEAYRKIPHISRQTYSQEAILALKPDFILGWFFDFSSRGRTIGSTDFWLQRNTNIYMTLTNGADFKAKHVLKDELDYISDIGRIVGKEEKAQSIIRSINTKIAACQKKTANLKKPKVLVISNIKRVLSIYTPRTLAGDILTQLGAEVMGSTKEKVGENEYMSLEELVMENPDIVFLQSAPELNQVTLETFYSIPALQNLECVKKKRVYTIPFYTIRCPGVRVDDAVEIFAKGLLDAAERR